VTKAAAREAISDLAPAARAFERAKKKGYVWIDPQTQMFETYELTGAWRPSEPDHPGQLRLGD
jgi:hypothetical protein